MKTIDNIPVSKIQRASKLLQTGAKVGLNYLTYVKDKVVENEEIATSKLNEANATDIYDSLKTLKGSALKVAQMLSMEQNVLPEAYIEKFSLSQFSVPPLSGPLVIKTFKSSLNQSPYDLFDEFSGESIHAASIGQVHLAKKDGKKLAVKIQYPGVADSIGSDLALVKPIALKMFNIPKKDSEKYFNEVKNKLIDETNYELELKQSEAISEACAHLKHIQFPTYYKDYSSSRILTMDWMDGLHLSEFAKTNSSSELANKVGQALWDFYMFQLIELKKVHADPHPGNFLVSSEGELIALDFGCVKEIPDSFHTPYVELLKPRNMENMEFFSSKMDELELIKPEDTEKEKKLVLSIFHELLSLFTRPFTADHFDFSDEKFFQHITDVGMKYAKDPALKKLNMNRGSQHFIYLNRTFFGLYNLLHQLKATKVEIDKSNYLN